MSSKGNKAWTSLSRGPDILNDEKRLRHELVHAGTWVSDTE